MANASTRMPGMVRTAQEVLDTEGIYGAFHVELRKAYEQPESMFREVAYGAGRQVIPRYSPKAFVQYIQLLEFILSNQDLIEDEELHHAVVLLGSAGILGAKHIAQAIDVSEGLVRRFTFKPHKGAKPRMGGAFNPAALYLVKDGMMHMLRNGDADYTALKLAKEKGISITLLSRLTGISAQALGRRFRKMANTEVDVDCSRDGVEARARSQGHSESSVKDAVAGHRNNVENRSESVPRHYAFDRIIARARERYSDRHGDNDNFDATFTARHSDLSAGPIHPNGENRERAKGPATERETHGSTQSS